MLARHIQEAEREVAEYEKGNEIEPAPIKVVEPISDAPEVQVTDNNAVADEQIVEQPEVKIETDNFEHKYKVMQGRIKAEKRKADADLLARDTEIQRLKDMFAKQEHQVTDNTVIPSKSLRDEMGEDTANIIERELATRESKIRAEMEERLSRIERSNVESSELSFRKGLTDSVPDWQTTDNNIEFMEWVDTLNGVGSQSTYRDAINSAHKRFDHESVAAIFKEFKRIKGAIPAKVIAPKKDFLNLVTPNKSRSSTNISTQEETVTMDAIDELTMKARQATDYKTRVKYADQAEDMMDKFLAQ